MTKFERWCVSHPGAAEAGAVTYLNRQKAKGEAYDAMLALLVKIRYCNWPALGLGIGLTEAEMDEVILTAERLNYGDAPKRPPRLRLPLALLLALREEHTESVAWFAAADWYEENGDDEWGARLRRRGETGRWSDALERRMFKLYKTELYRHYGIKPYPKPVMGFTASPAQYF